MSIAGDRVKRLVASLASYAEVTYTESGDTVVTHVEDTVLAAPLLLVIDGAQVDAYSRAHGDDAREVFPDVSAEEGSLRLLMVHLEEIIRGKPVDGALLTLSAGGFVLSNNDLSPRDSLASGDYEWRAHPPT